MAKEILVNPNATTADVITLIRQTAKRWSKSQLIKTIAKQHAGNDRQLFEWLKGKVSYQPDKNEQWVRTPRRALRDGIGNCVDYTTFLSSVLLAQGRPHTLRMTGRGDGYAHIYPVVDGRVLDATTDFGREPDYAQKKDYPVRLKLLQGYKNQNAAANRASISRRHNRLLNQASTTVDHVQAVNDIIGSYDSANAKCDQFFIYDYILGWQAGLAVGGKIGELLNYLNSIQQISAQQYNKVAAIARNFAQNAFFQEGFLCNKSERRKAAVEAINAKITELGTKVNGTGTGGGPQTGTSSTFGSSYQECISLGNNKALCNQVFLGTGPGSGNGNGNGGGPSLAGINVKTLLIGAAVAFGLSQIEQ